MNILAIDTSNQVMGVALLKNDQLVGEYVTNVKVNHSIRLMPAIDQLLKDTNTQPEGLDKIVVAKGPGSFTGVRIGLSTAKTMAWALNIPVVGVSSLEAVAYQTRFHHHYICPFFDARRGLVYTGLYYWDQENLTKVKEETNPLFEDWLKELRNEKRKILFLSQDMKLHENIIISIMGEMAIIPEQPYHIPRPSLLAFAGAKKESDELHILTPNYLRLAEAEAKWLEQQGKK